ncbi:MAG: primosomal protein N', partial [Ginsengibacter sp.]
MIDNLSKNEDLFYIPSTESTTGQTGLWAEIILPLAIPKTYTYKIPEHLIKKTIEGVRAEVVFGKNKKYAGIVKSFSNKQPAYETKEILNIIDDEPIIYPQQLKLWNWMSEYYMCSEGEVMAAALPTHLKLNSETVLIFNEEYGEDFSQLDNDEYLVAEALLIKHELRVPEVQQVLDVNHVYPVIKKLIDKKVCFIWEAINEKFRVKKETYVILNPQYDNEEKLNEMFNNWGKSPKQMELLLSYLHLLKTEGEVTQSALLTKSKATTAQLKGLADKNILFLEK